MPGFEIKYDIRKKGPIFQNPTPKIQQMITGVEEAMAQFAKAYVLHRLSQVLQNPTGYYESQIMIDRSTPDLAVTDSRTVVYGPWLEGTGSRNKTTRFKGYHTFRNARQETDRRATELARPVLARFIDEMNG
jgi:hypothetical protein